MTTPFFRLTGFCILCSCIIILTACGGGSNEEDQEYDQTKQTQLTNQSTIPYTGDPLVKIDPQGNIYPIPSYCANGGCK